jgi:hypothetical protein
LRATILGKAVTPKWTGSEPLSRRNCPLPTRIFVFLHRACNETQKIDNPDGQ